MIKLSSKEEKSFTRYLYQADYLGEGTGRKVYRWRDYVIKVAKNRQGRKQNYNERLLYQLYGSNNTCLAKVYAYSKKIIIMEMVEPKEPQDIDVNQAERIGNWLDTVCQTISEDHYDSFGIAKDGRLVAYDYGDYEKMYNKKLHFDISTREYIATKIGELLWKRKI